jgi:hypothetical protein
LGRQGNGARRVIAAVIFVPSPLVGEAARNFNKEGWVRGGP